MVLLNTTKLVCLSIIISINFVDTQRRHRGYRRQPRYELENYSNSRIEPRIVGGEYAKEGDAPYAVYLQFPNDPKGWSCVGALIGPRAVITAAHCLRWSWEKEAEGVWHEEIIAKYGGLNWTSTPFSNKVLRYWLPQEWLDFRGSNTRGIDLAILRLEDTVVESELVKIIELTDEAPENQVGKMVKFTGWGKANRPGAKYEEFEYPPSGESEWFYYPELLKIHYFELISMEECDTFNMNFGLPTRNTSLCIYDRTQKSTRSCFGDSGSPVVLDGKLIGVQSYGKECKIDAPSVIISTYLTRDWINSKTKGLRRRRSRLNNNMYDNRMNDRYGRIRDISPYMYRQDSYY